MYISRWVPHHGITAIETEMAIKLGIGNIREEEFKIDEAQQ